jgi:hypothetical protein
VWLESIEAHVARLRTAIATNAEIATGAAL